jgi:hypothetical protein
MYAVDAVTPANMRGKKQGSQDDEPNNQRQSGRGIVNIGKPPTGLAVFDLIRGYAAKAGAVLCGFDLLEVIG